MKIRVKLYATLRRFLPKAGIGEVTEIEVPEEATIQTVISHLHIPPEESKVIFVNGSHQTLNFPLHANDLVVIFPAMGGG
jgi:molybdopterin converting factor small subunit